MKQTRNLELFIFLALAIYFFVTVWLFFSKREEIFPIFTWSLYSSVPTKAYHDYSLQIVEVNGVPQTPSILIDESAQFPVPIETYKADLLQISMYRDIQQLGLAVGSDKGDDTILYRRKNVERFFGKARVKYALVVRQYDPRERLLSGKVDEVIELATFTSGGQQ